MMIYVNKGKDMLEQALKFSYFYRNVHTWNLLPENIRRAPSSNSLKGQLVKRFLMNTYFASLS